MRRYMIGLAAAAAVMLQPGGEAKAEQEPASLEDDGHRIGVRMPDLAERLIAHLTGSGAADGKDHWALVAGLAAGISEARSSAGPAPVPPRPEEALSSIRSREADGPPPDPITASPHLPAAARDVLPRDVPPLAGTAAALASFGDDAFWFRLGAEDSPGIYFIADPACPYCARAVQELAGRISDGLLHLRVALAPFLTAQSRVLAGRIMVHDDPATAAWELFLSPAPPPADAGPAPEIGPIGMALLETNLEWMLANGVSAVPHFIWIEDGIWRRRSGVQDAAVFDGAGMLEDGPAIHAPDAVLDMLADAAGGG